ncbi:MAG: hypothetical protein L3J39_04220 [Verrucomicrobiales bacterium]|nr:hypothetical protein [Verrucomicrobiales bacterium]
MTNNERHIRLQPLQARRPQLLILQPLQARRPQCPNLQIQHPANAPATVTLKPGTHQLTAIDP